MVWDTPFSKWFESGEGWYKKIRREKTLRIELANALLQQAGEPEITTKRKKANEAGKKARELPPLDWPEGRRNSATVRTLAIRGDNNSVVGWLNGETRQNKHKKAIGEAQKDLQALWKEECGLNDRNEE